MHSQLIPTFADMDIIFSKTLLRLLKERGHGNAKEFLGATNKDYSNLLKLLRCDSNMKFESLDYVAKCMDLYPYITMIPREYLPEESFKLFLEKYGLCYNVKEGQGAYLLTNIVEGLKNDGQLDALSPFPLLAVKEVLVDSQVHGNLGEAADILMDALIKIHKMNHPDR